MYIFTSESVTDGHPDKVCDQMADAILDAALSQDKYSKMAVECTIKDKFVLVYGEANTTATLNYEEIVKGVLTKIGYSNDFEVLVKVSQQSPEINSAVVKDEIAAGDQGIMFGFACNETHEYMPMPIMLAHALSRQLKKCRKEHDWIKPDGKTQVSVLYTDEHEAVGITNIVVSTQHAPEVSQEFIREFIIDEVIKKVVPSDFITDETTIVINPSGAFTVGGPEGDSGTTGRKIIVDTYGGMGRIGGGCFSSKDPSKVDRSAAYYARYVAKSMVAAGLAKRFEVQLSYAIGLTDPQSVFVDAFGTSEYSNEELLEIVMKNFDFSVQNIIDELDLLRPIYQTTANFGHFGDPTYPWEQIKPLTF